MTANNKSERTGKYRAQLTLCRNTVGNWVIDSQQRLQTTDLLYLQKKRSGRLRSQFLSQGHILSNLYSWNTHTVEGCVHCSIANTFPFGPSSSTAHKV
jgi:hypothetical protein